MKADVTGRPVRTVAATEATALGAAMLAAIDAGIFADLDEAVACCVHLDEPAPTSPIRRRASAYGDAYGRYRDLFDAVEPSSSRCRG